MAPSDIKKEPTLFEILALTPKSLEGQDPPTQAKAVKQAYRRALLKHHPDKNQQAKLQSDANNNQNASSQKSETHYTVDQITHAYTVLSDSKKRREYVRSLQTQTRTFSTKTTTSSSPSFSSSPPGRRATTSGTTHHHHHQQQQQQASFRTGVETVDLDDLGFDERRGVYYRSCRCGSARGYCFRELDLEEVGEDGELMVECVGCSLWLRVLFEELEDDVGAQQQPQQVQQHAANMKEVHRSTGSGKTGGWSWKFSLGISVGGGAGLNVGAKAGRG